MLSQRTLAVTVCAVALASFALAAAAPPAESGPPESSPLAPAPADAKAIYMEHCAKCHGETGDGKGNEELERPARSFLLGGYSYGNTQKAVTRSVVHGIPGTPMPAFGETLDAKSISAVVDYVIALGPRARSSSPARACCPSATAPSSCMG